MQSQCGALACAYLRLLLEVCTESYLCTMANPFSAFNCTGTTSTSGVSSQQQVTTVVCSTPTHTSCTVSSLSTPSRTSASATEASFITQSLSEAPGPAHLFQTPVRKRKASTVKFDVSPLPIGPPKGIPETLGEKLGDKPLRLAIIGHNPSAHAWTTGHYYSNPSNWFWRILVDTGIAPPDAKGPDGYYDDSMPGVAGVGFTDVGSGHPGTDSAAFKSCVFETWADAFYTRMREHTARACAAIGCRCGLCGAPRLIAFSGKRHYVELMNVGRHSSQRKVSTVPLGRQAVLPSNWPLPASTEVWVMTSTSGASALTREARYAPWQQLAERLKEINWPISIARCR